MRVLALLSFVLLAACGQSGDLYLPAEQREQPAAAPAAAGTPPAGEDQKKDSPKEAR